MGTGLLEQLLNRLDLLNERLDALENMTGTAITVNHDVAAHVITTKEQGQTVETGNSETVSGDGSGSTLVEVDKHGIPWDARIHASTKTKTTKNEWKRRRGVNDIEHNKVIEELKATTSTGVASEISETSAPNKPGSPSKPNTPSMPNKPGSPSKPETASAGPVTDTQPLVPFIDRITSYHGVQPAIMSAELREKFGVDFINQLNAGQIEECKTWLNGWMDYLDNIDDVVGDISDLDAANNASDKLCEGVMLYMNQHGSLNGKLDTVPKAKLSDLYATLNKYFTEWNNYYGSQQ